MHRILPIMAASLALSSSSNAIAQNETGPVQVQPAPVQNQPAPVAPVQNQAAPVQNQPTPVQNQPAPVPEPVRAGRESNWVAEDQDGYLRLGHDRHRLQLRSNRPPLVRRDATDEAAGNSRGVRSQWRMVLRRPPEPIRRQDRHADSPGRLQDDLRIRALRRRKRGRGDDVSPATCLGRDRPLRRGPNLERLHGSGCLPELGRVLGAQRHGLLSQRPGPMDAAPGSPVRRDRDREARQHPGRQWLRRDRGHSERLDALSAAGLHGSHSRRGRLGPRPARRDRAVHPLGPGDARAAWRSPATRSAGAPP